MELSSAGILILVAVIYPAFLSLIAGIALVWFAIKAEKCRAMKVFHFVISGMLVVQAVIYMVCLITNTAIEFLPWATYQIPLLIELLVIIIVRIVKKLKNPKASLNEQRDN